MNRRDIGSDSSVSRRETIRFGLISGLSLTGLTTAAAAHDSDEGAADGTKKSSEKSGPATDTGKQQAPDDQQQPEEQQQADGKEQQPENEEPAAGGRSASITMHDHETGGSSVTVESVTMSEGGFISIHDRRRFQGQVLGSIIGITDYLEAGTHTNVSVPLFTANATAPGPAAGQNASGLTEAQRLIAIPHQDGNNSGQFDGEPDEAYKNGPSTLGRFGAVNDAATVSVAGATGQQPAEHDH